MEAPSFKDSYGVRLALVHYWVRRSWLPCRAAHALAEVIGTVVFSIIVFFFGLSHWVWLSRACAFISGTFADCKILSENVVRLEAARNTRIRIYRPQFSAVVTGEKGSRVEE